MMDYQAFHNSLSQHRCPVDISPCLQALWYDANDDWHRAHEIVQSLHDSMATRVHAYLHRKEGDNWNSRYWHGQAGSKFPQGMSLQEEWDMLARELTSPE